MLDTLRSAGCAFLLTVLLVLALGFFAVKDGEYFFWYTERRKAGEPFGSWVKRNNGCIAFFAVWFVVATGCTRACLFDSHSDRYVNNEPTATPWWELLPPLAWALIVFGICTIFLLGWYYLRRNKMDKNVKYNKNMKKIAGRELLRKAERGVIWLTFFLVVGIGLYVVAVGDPSEDTTEILPLMGVGLNTVVIIVVWVLMKDSLVDITLLREDIKDIKAVRAEVGTLRQFQEAYALSLEGENLRIEGHPAMAFEHYLQSAFIFARDPENYEMRLLQALALMRMSIEDVDRLPAEREGFIRNRERFAARLSELLQAVKGRLAHNERAESDIYVMINDLKKF